MAGLFSSVLAAALSLVAFAGAVPTRATAQGLGDSFQANLQSGADLLDEGRSAAAIPYLEEAVRLDNDNAAARRLLGRALFGVGEFNRALDAYAAAVRLEPGDVESYMRMAG